MCKSLQLAFSLLSCHTFQFENLKNENTSLKRRMEQLLSETQRLGGKRGEDREEEVKGERGVQGAESCRGEGEGKVRMMEERRREIIGRQREAGVGEEVLQAQGVAGETCEKVVASHRRGEAEGGQKDREKQDNGVTPCSKPPATLQNDAAITAADQSAASLCRPDLELLTNRFQEAQEEADRQAHAAQDLRSKLAEQSKRTWVAEQRLVVLEAEHQHLKKAAESLADARRQIEVGTLERTLIEGRVRPDVSWMLSLAVTTGQAHQCLQFTLLSFLQMTAAHFLAMHIKKKRLYIVFS